MRSGCESGSECCLQIERSAEESRGAVRQRIGSRVWTNTTPRRVTLLRVAVCRVVERVRRSLQQQRGGRPPRRRCAGMRRTAPLAHREQAHTQHTDQQCNASHARLHPRDIGEQQRGWDACVWRVGVCGRCQSCGVGGRGEERREAAAALAQDTHRRSDPTSTHLHCRVFSESNLALARVDRSGSNLTAVALHSAAEGTVGQSSRAEEDH